MDDESPNIWAAPTASDASAGAAFQYPAREPAPPRRGGVPLALWWAVGLALAGSLLLFPVGLLLLPAAVTSGAYLATRGNAWPEVLGAGLGIATGLAFVAYRNRDAVPCETGTGTVVLTGEEAFACGGTSPEPWLVAAVVLGAIASAGYGMARWQGRRSR